MPYGVELDREQARKPCRKAWTSRPGSTTPPAGTLRDGLQETDSPYSPFARVAEELGYAGDPTLEPSPFFTTLHGYRTAFDRPDQR